MPSPLQGSSRLQQNLHLITLFVFAISQPLYSLLGDQVGFFTANQYNGTEIILFCIALSLIPPLCLILIKELFGLVHASLRNGLHSIFIMGLSTLIIIPLVNPLIATAWIALFISLLAGFLFTVLYWKKPTLQSLTSFLSLAVLIFPILFLFSPKIEPLLSEQHTTYYHPEKHPVDTQKKYPPVVVVFWDELPYYSLLNEKEEIDAVRFPHFAEFASHATTFTNMHSVGGSTLWAVPAMLSGQVPSHAEQHTPQQLETNLFTMLGQTHNMDNVVEKHTSICPPELCKPPKRKPFKKLYKALPDLTAVYLHLVTPKQWADGLPDVSNNWGEFSWSKPVVATKTLTASGIQDTKKRKAAPDHKRGLFHKFLKKMKPYDANDTGKKPPLYFMHIVFPHVPYNYTPSGKYYSATTYRYFTTWHDERETFYDYQRYMMQLAATDGLMGDMIGRLKELGLYDTAIIIVAADHGASWDKVGTERRKLGPSNYHNVMKVPLFIKLPGQSKPQYHHQPMLILDIVPTLADILNMPLPGKMDGHSVFSPDYPSFNTVKIIDNLGQNWYNFPLVTAAQQRAAIQKQIAWFGSGSLDKLYTTSPFFNALLGKPLTGQYAMSPQWHYQLNAPNDYLTVDLGEKYIPAQMTGWIETSSPENFPKNIAIALNGHIWATYPYFKQDGNRLYFEAMLPEKAFVQGNNEIRIFAITGSNQQPRLSEIPAAGQ